MSGAPPEVELTNDAVVDVAALGLLAGDASAVTSRRGCITLEVCASEAPGPGSTSIPFCWPEAVAHGKIPEFTSSAVRVDKARAPALADLDGAAE
ncbi:hypothetical protein [Nannocystis punicea]|uniref:Uncharacterized protein n=1 Tax=Nannocystis punicea TaxID=2995304 RepID=A0ABY7HCZ5_9BACT|nr:hypothetical protein [Nannocystis poenicansa]WAS97147.1 hypothetical protein O0S08_13450 [Nannocystis poenicansa]